MPRKPSMSREELEQGCSEHGSEFHPDCSECVDSMILLPEDLEILYEIQL
jgi:hypothetical protein